MGISKKVVSLSMCVAIFCVLLCGCAPKSDMVTMEDINKMFAENSELFTETAHLVSTFDGYVKDDIPVKGTMYFIFENNEVVPYMYDTKVDYKISKKAYEKLYTCFMLMDSIVNKEYDEDEYYLSIGYSETLDETKVDFEFSDTTKEFTQNLSFSEDNLCDYPGGKKLDENWFYWCWSWI